MCPIINRFAAVGLVALAVASVGATVWAFPVPPVRDEAQLRKASQSDQGYGINDIDADCKLVRLDTVDAHDRVHPHLVRLCD